MTCRSRRKIPRRRSHGGDLGVQYLCKHPRLPRGLKKGGVGDPTQSREPATRQGSFDRTIRVWTIATPGAGPLILPGHQAWVVALAFSPDGRRLASGSGAHYSIWGSDWANDFTVRLWDLGSPSPTDGVVLGEHLDTVTAVGFSPDGIASRFGEPRRHRSGVGSGCEWSTAYPNGPRQRRSLMGHRAGVQRRQPVPGDRACRRCEALECSRRNGEPGTVGGQLHTRDGFSPGIRTPPSGARGGKLNQ